MLGRNTSVVTLGACRIARCIVDAVQLTRLRHGPPCREGEIGIAAFLLKNGQLIVHATEGRPSLAPGIGQSEVPMNKAPGRVAAWPCREGSVNSVHFNCIPNFPANGHFRIVSMMEMNF